MPNRIVTGAVLAGLLAAGATPCWAWGSTGHRVIGQIAENHLKPQAAQAVRDLLGHDSLAEISNWADSVRSSDEWRHTSPWHYVNFADGEQDYESAKKSPEGDAVTGMRWAEKVLRDPASSREEKVAALKFFVHLVGDIHQPLHASRAADRGGNLTEAVWMHEKEPTNLHRVWDSQIIDHENLSYTEWTKFLDHPADAEIRAWQDSGYVDWVNESHELSRQCYDFDPKQPLSFPYFHTSLVIVQKRLLQGGIRLAGKLNLIFAGGAE